MKICLDPGHGGSDSGAVHGLRQEKIDVLPMALATGKILEKNGSQVIYTRKSDEYKSPTEKANIANQNQVDLMVSFHRNATTNPDAKGVEILLYTDSGQKANLANSLCKRFGELGFINRGIKERSDLAVLRHTKMPAILLEVGFISNNQDNTRFDNHFNELCRILAEEILSYFGKELKPEGDGELRWVKENNHWYLLKSNQKQIIGWRKIDQKWYYLNPENGQMMTGFICINGKTYYMRENGAMLTNPMIFEPDGDGTLY